MVKMLSLFISIYFQSHLIDKDLSTERSKLSQGNSFAHEKKNCLSVSYHSELKNNAMNLAKLAFLKGSNQAKVASGRNLLQ